MKHLLAITAAIAALAAAGLFVACGGDDHGMDNMGAMHSEPLPAGGVVVRLSNWAIEPMTTSAPSGEVTFRAMHDMMHTHGKGDGGNIHELAVARRRADGQMEILGRVADIKMGEYKDLTLRLEPGEYELQCNLVEEVGGKAIGHYVKGMHTTFTVT